MEGWQKDHISMNLTKLVETTTCIDSLTVFLARKGLIGTQDVHRLKNAGESEVPFAEAKELYEILVTKEHGYACLITALQETDQFGPLEILQKRPQPKELISLVSSLVIPMDDSEKKSVLETNDWSEFVRNRPVRPDPTVIDVSMRGFKKSVKENTFFSQNLPKNFCDPLVQKPREKMQFNDDHYKLPTGFKGLALLVNIFKSGQSGSRKCAAIDTRRLEVIFETLGYEVVLMTGSEKAFTRDIFSDLINKFKIRCAELEVRSFAVFLGGHGTESKLEMSDGSLIDLEGEVFSKLCTPPDRYHDVLENEHWTKIPKLFFIQAGRSQAKQSMPVVANCLISYACKSGKPAWNTQEDGSYYVAALAEILATFAFKYDIFDILEMVRHLVVCNSKAQGKKKEEIQEPEYIFRGNFEKLYFNILPITYKL